MCLQKSKRIINYILLDKVGRFIRLCVRNRIDRLRIKKTDFTIFSQNCIGSIMYHDLGLRFNSPTINLLFTGDDFVRFLSNVRYYLNQDIKFIESSEKYPVGMLDDIRLDFVHYKNNREAEDKWNERKKRINWNKLYIIACDKDMSDANILKFLSLNYKHKILFLSSKRANLLKDCVSNYSCVIIQNKFFESDSKLLNFSNILGDRYYSKFFDYIEFLNS